MAAPEGRGAWPPGVGHLSLDALALQYIEDWLSSIKAKIMLGIIP